MLIKVDDKFKPFMNGLSEINIECNKVSEGISKWLNLFPQMQVHLLDNEAEIGFQSYFILNGVPAYELEHAGLPVDETSVLRLMSDLPAGASKAWQIISSIVLIVVGVVVGVYAGWTGVGGVLAGTLITQGIHGLFGGGIVGLIALLINGLPTPDQNGSIDNSSIYGFDGMRNTTASGTPLNIVYGEHRVGGHVLNMYANYSNEKDKYAAMLNVQLGLCEGEIDRISKIEIDGNPVSFYSAVEVFTHNLGFSEQPVMENFDRIESTISFGRKVIPLNDPLDTSLLPSTTTDASHVYGVVADGKIYEGYYEPVREYIGIVAP